MNKIFISLLLLCLTQAHAQTFQRGDKVKGSLKNVKSFVTVDEDNSFISSPETVELSFKHNICTKAEVTATQFDRSSSGFLCITDAKDMPTIHTVTIPVSQEDIPEINFEFGFEEIQAVLGQFQEFFTRYSLPIDIDLSNFSLGVEVYEVDHSVFGDRYDNIGETHFIDSDRMINEKRQTSFITGMIDGDVSLEVSSRR